MSSSAGVRPKRTPFDIAIESLRDTNNTDIQNMKRFSAESSPIAGQAGGASTNSATPGGSFLNIAGETPMIGAIAFNPVAVAINSDGHIDITPSDTPPQRYSTYVLMTGAGTPDDLNFIDGAANNGQLLYLQGTETQIIILKHAKLVNIANIVGTTTVTVTTTSAHNLVTGEKVNILSTTNFNIENATITVTGSTTFTYSATGSATPETSGLVQNGNIVTPDGKDVTIDGTVGSNVIPVATLIFDISVEGNGAWRVIDVPVTASGISFPIDFPEDDRGTVGASTQSIVFTNSTRHSVKMIVSGDVDLAFTAPPTNETAYTNIIIVQDGTGGHTVTVPSGTINKTIVDAGILTGANEETGIVIKFAFGTFYAFLETGNIVSGGGFSGNLSDLTIDVTKNWAAQGISNFGSLTGVLGIDMDGATALLQGVKTIRFFDDDPNTTIGSVASGLEFRTVATQQFSFFTDQELFRIDQQQVNQPAEIQLFQGSIENAGEIIFTTSSDAIIGATEPGIGYDATNFDMISNIPTNASASYQWKIAGAIEMTLALSGTNADLTVDQVTNLKQLGFDDNLIDPAVNGIFTRNGADVKVFSGGAVRNLSNITATASANVTLSNLGTTDINAALLPEASATLDLGSELLPWRIGHFREIEFPVTTSGTPSGTTDTQISVTNANHMAFNNTVNGAGFQWYFEGVEKWAMVSSLLSGDGILLENSLTLNDSTTNPVSTGELTRNGSIVKLEANGFDVRRTTLVSAEASTLNLIKVDSGAVANDNVGKLSFQVFDTPTLTTYGDISVIISNATDAGIMSFNVRADNTLIGAMSLTGDDNNQRFMMLFGGTNQARIQPAFGRMGYFVNTQVTDFSLVIGSAGSLEIPRLADNSPTLTALNSAFGAFDGAFGYESVDERLYVRESSTRWVFFNTDGAVT